MSRGRINAIFAVITIGLATSAVLSMFLSETPVIRESATIDSSDVSLPENHLPPDAAEKLSALIRKSEEDPENPGIHAEIGNFYYDLGEYDKAVLSYRKSLDILPKDPNVETDLATCLHYLGRHEEALKTLNNVLKYRPGFAQALYNKGIVLIHGKNDIEGGIEVWEEILRTELDPARRVELEQSIRHLKSSVR